MKQRNGKHYVIIKYVVASSVKAAIRDEENVLAVIEKHKEIQELASAIGFDLSPAPDTPFYEEEQPVPETIGFRAPRTRPRSRNRA